METNVLHDGYEYRLNMLHINQSNTQIGDTNIDIGVDIDVSAISVLVYPVKVNQGLEWAFQLSHAENLDRFLCRKNCLTRKLTQRLRDRSFSLRGGVAYAAAYATLRHCRLCLRSIDMT